MSCPECFKGHIHKEKPTGQIVQLYGRETYIATPPNGLKPKGIVVVIPDAYGLPFPNNQLLCDHFAEKGQYTVYLPDFMDGNAAPMWLIQTMADVYRSNSVSDYLWKPWNGTLFLGSFGPFLYKNRFSVTYPRVTAWLDKLRCNEGKSLPVAAAGYCWGGKHGVNLASGPKASNGMPLVDAVFVAHPSALEVPKEFEAVKVPLSVAIGDHDFLVKGEEVGRYKEMLGKVAVETEMRVYSGAGHGFAVRADPDTERAREQAEEGERQALEWFAKHFARSNEGV